MKITLALPIGALVALPVVSALGIQADGSQPVQDAVHDQVAATLLFVQSAPGMSYDAAAKRLTLQGVSPAVTFFTDRPYRIAGHTLLSTFVQIWGEGRDSFASDPPNADISIIEEGKIHSAVIELSMPTVVGKNLTYEAELLEGSLPASGGVSSLFIDGLVLRGAGRGAAGGAVVGAICGDAGKGAAIGAAVGGVAGASRKRRAEKYESAQVAVETTRVVNVPNSNGSFTPVTLNLVEGGWKGPKGEIYPTLPTADQLKKLYAK